MCDSSCKASLKVTRMRHRLNIAAIPSIPYIYALLSASMRNQEGIGEKILRGGHRGGTHAANASNALSKSRYPATLNTVSPIPLFV
jgi:hypothetical protein